MKSLNFSDVESASYLDILELTVSVAHLQALKRIFCFILVSVSLVFRKKNSGASFLLSDTTQLRHVTGAKFALIFFASILT